MSETKFSNYPWRVKLNSNGRLHLLSDTGSQIAAFWNCKERDANASLIAASPKMYKMLIQLQVEGGLGVARHRQIDNLLKEARGEK